MSEVDAESTFELPEEDRDDRKSDGWDEERVRLFIRILLDDMIR